MKIAMYLVKQFHGNFISNTFRLEKIKLIFDVK